MNEQDIYVIKSTILNRFVRTASLILLVGCLLASCYVPGRLVRGVYVNGDGDTLRMRPDYAFKIEMANPDSAGLQQLKFASGRWHSKKNKVYLTVATKAMGKYWQCVPMKAGWGTLRRPKSCSDKKEGRMLFRKVHVKSPDKKNRKKKKEKEDPATLI